MPRLFESKRPLKTAGGQRALRDAQQELRRLGTGGEKKNIREQGWRCNLLQGEDVFLEAEKALLERQG